ncbi:hypothetical protein ACFRCX_34520 [Streptomyces sp. NPDC056652]|uniref:hypothetical protein n=1 Tax=Streptomyces sp. NPDC056652 TaxID=3345893 RepID=UPI00369F16DE
MPTFYDVYHAPLGKLKTAADDWAEMTTKLETLAEDARTTMAEKSKDEYWRGANASVTKPFIVKTAKEFDDAAKAAKGIGLILEDGYAVFKKAKDDLARIVDTDAPAQSLVVTAYGMVEALYPLEDEVRGRFEADYAKNSREQQARIESLQRRINAIVETCDEADVATANALRANITGDQHNFSAPKYKSLDAEEAQRALDLAKKGTDLTHTELLRLNELLKDNHSSREFSRTFYDGLGGPKKSLEFFGKLAGDTYEGTRQDKERLKDIQSLQKNLGLNLATATDPAGKNDTWSKTWSDEMRKLGAERVPVTKYDMNPPYGYQLLGGIMRYGNYDPKFLNPIVEHAIQLQHKNPGMFAETKPTGGWQMNGLNPSGVNGAGYDPVVSMLEALGHSPEASKEFFTEPPTAYNEDGSVKDGFPPDLGNAKGGADVMNYLDYFADQDYKSFPDVDGSYDPDKTGETSAYMPDALGHALESATLGYAWDDPSPNPVRDATTAEVMQKVMAKYGVDAELLKHQEALSDSLGNMGAGYIDDINWAFQESDRNGVFAPTRNSDAHPMFDPGITREFLGVLGQHPDAYASVTTAERIYTSSVLEAQVSADGKIIDPGAARTAVGIGAEVQGILDQSRGDQIEAEGLKRHEDFETAQESRSSWVEFGAASAIGAGAAAVGVAFLPATAAAAGAAAILVPLAVDTGSGTLEQIAGQLIGDWSDSSIEENKEKIEELTGAERSAVFKSGESSALSPAQNLIDYYDLDRESVFSVNLRESAELGYGRGNRRAMQQLSGPETG